MTNKNYRVLISGYFDLSRDSLKANIGWIISNVGCSMREGKKTFIFTLWCLWHRHNTKHMETIFRMSHVEAGTKKGTKIYLKWTSQRREKQSNFLTLWRLPIPTYMYFCIEKSIYKRLTYILRKKVRLIHYFKVKLITHTHWVIYSSMSLDLLAT